MVVTSSPGDERRAPGAASQTGMDGEERRMQACGPCADPGLSERLVDYWRQPTVVARNHFKNKSLSCWACNFAVGCQHGCEFCYVPSVSANKLKPLLSQYGVYNPDLQWGQYLLVRPWDEKKFLSSLNTAERIPVENLNRDGNRAVMMCSTTDAYQVIGSPDATLQNELTNALRFSVRRSLELILRNSTLNVRILTRSPLCRRDFDLFHEFGPRLLLGASLPTLNNRLARVYEPNAPAPSQRLALLKQAKEAGLHVYVAVAPTYPECDAADLEATLRAVGEIEPVTIFAEPINVRAENVGRIAAHARDVGVTLDTSVFASPERWRRYATGTLRTVEQIARDLGLGHKLHLWPDASLGSRAAASCTDNPSEHMEWLRQWWSRISEWPAA